MRDFKIVCACCLVVVCGFDAQAIFGAELPRFVIESERSIYSVDDQTSAPHNQVHFPYLYEAEDGTWFMCHHEGPHYAGMKVFGLSWDDENAKYLTDDRPQTVMSLDRGVTWRPWPGMPHRERDLRLQITELRDGSLMSYLSYMDDFHSNRATLVFIYSEDGGATWRSEEAEVAGLPLTQGRSGVLWGSVLEITADHLLVPYYGEQFVDPQTDKARFLTGILQSKDRGKSWQHLAVIATADTPGEEGPNESAIIRLGGQALYAVFRVGDKPGSTMHESRSEDLGRTWSKPKPLPGGEEGVSPQLIEMGERLVLVFGRRVSGDRALIAWMSSDGGKSWARDFRIFEGTGKVYANLQKLSEDRLRVVYDASPVEHDDGRVTNNIVRTVLRLE